MGVYGCIWVCKLSCGILTVGVIGAGVFGHVYPRSYQPLRVRRSAGVDPSGGRAGAGHVAAVAVGFPLQEPAQGAGQRRGGYGAAPHRSAR